MRQTQPSCMCPMQGLLPKTCPSYRGPTTDGASHLCTLEGREPCPSVRTQWLLECLIEFPSVCFGYNVERLRCVLPILSRHVAQAFPDSIFYPPTAETDPDRQRLMPGQGRSAQDSCCSCWSCSGVAELVACGHVGGPLITTRAMCPRLKLGENESNPEVERGFLRTFFLCTLSPC
jgi:hypothetical protein